MTEPHIADAESEFFILNVTPDFCDVDDTTVPFDISQTLKPEKSDFAKSVFARGEPVISKRSTNPTLASVNVNAQACRMFLNKQASDEQSGFLGRASGGH